jgi:adenylate kinase
MCISAGNSKKNLRTFVLCSGILYGDGEDVFYSLFRQAWLQEPPALPIIGDGRNRMPTVHVRDLAQFVRACIEKKPPQQYIFAIDHTPRPLQKKIVEAISRSLGTGKTVNVSL